MADITAQLSLTPTAPGFDPVAILGAETADNQAFGDILAGQIAGQPAVKPSADAALAIPAPPPLPAGNRQPTGNILPGATEFLPEAAPAAVATPAVAVPPGLAALATKHAVPLPSVLPFPQDPATEVPAGKSEQTHPANPVHSLIKTLAAAIRGQRQTEGETPVTDAAEPTVPVVDGEGTEAVPVVVTADIVVAVALPVLPAFVAATPAPATQDKAVPARTSFATPAPMIQTAAAAATETLPVRAPERPAETALRDLGPVISTQPVVRRAVQAIAAETLSVPVLTVPADAAAVAATTPAAAVTLVAASPRAAGPVATARIKVVASDIADRVAKPADRAAATLAALADRAPIADRILPTATPIVADGLTQTATPAPITTAASAPTIEMPRHDFAALVERLVEARHASTTQSTHASVTHSEFGQVSLNFQQDGKDLSVSMSSADPDFALAVQAAMPAERQNFNADSNQRGQSQQSQSQATGSSSHSSHEASGERGGDATGQPGGNRQGRNPRGGNDSSNPSQRWTGEQPQSRGGVFA
jgi:hypothetical protein